MAHTNIKFPDNMRRFSHGLDAQNPFLIYRGNMRSDESHFIGDTHLDPQLFIVVSGEVDFHLDDHMFKGKAGDIFISNFWEPHAFRKTTPELNFIVVTFSLFSVSSFGSSVSASAEVSSFSAFSDSSDSAQTRNP